jgi:hypothetical protein
MKIGIHQLNIKIYMILVVMVAMSLYRLEKVGFGLVEEI